MPKWFELDDTELYRRLDQVYGRPARIPREDDPLSPVERDLGMRIFGGKGDGKIYTKDLSSDGVGSGKNLGEAIADLRGKIQKS
ncbi:MAG: hypothetical protein HY268_11960 [Deltaproteobacteria bacterium]|nr:hypothetical protein [Deltaproteobacteria bacterium]